MYISVYFLVVFRINADIRGSFSYKGKFILLQKNN